MPVVPPKSVIMGNPDTTLTTPGANSSKKANRNKYMRVKDALVFKKEESAFPSENKRNRSNRIEGALSPKSSQSIRHPSKDPNTAIFLEKEESEFIPHGKPFFFLVDKENHVAFAARDYVRSWRREDINHDLYKHNSPSRNQNLLISYKIPDTDTPVEAGSLKQVKTNTLEGYLLQSLLLIQPGSFDCPHNEDAQLNIANALFCFETGTIVKKNEKIVERLRAFCFDPSVADGVYIAMHHAVACSYFELAKFFARLGADICMPWEGDQKSSLEKALEHKDLTLAKEWINRLGPSIAFDELSYLLQPRPSKFTENALDLIRRRLEQLRENA